MMADEDIFVTINFGEHASLYITNTTQGIGIELVTEIFQGTTIEAIGEFSANIQAASKLATRIEMIIKAAQKE